MCGRARCTLRADDIPRACHRTGGPVRSVNMDRYRPSYNVAPGANLSVVRRDDGSGGDGVVLHCMKWGLVPSFTKKAEKPDFFKMFNARSESISEKASFRRLLPKNRCLVAVEGFYEWKKDGSKKQPFYIHFKDCRALLFAALYDCWENAEGEKLYTFTILTTSSSSTLQWLHDRMPVILGDKGSMDTWLNGSSSSEFNTLLKPYEGPDLVWYPVTPAIGKLSFDGPECIKEIKIQTEEKNTISRFFSTKGVKKEEDAITEEKSLFHKSVNTNLPNLKEEPKTEDNEGSPSSAEKKDNDSKSSVSLLTHEVSRKPALLKVLKEEPQAEDEKISSPTEKKDDNSKSDVPMLIAGAPVKCQSKRDYVNFLADEKPAKDGIATGKSPAKKKGNLKGNDDKQPTLFSYFGKR
ncbi:hypothetical protein SLE2022_249660 [Rubroshorea leprosula]